MEADRRRAARRSDAVHYRIKDGYCVRDLCGDSLVIPIGREAINANQVALLSPTGQFIWDKLATAQTFGELVQAVLAEYQAAFRGVHMLKDAGLPVCINTTFTRNNATDMEDIIGFSKKNNIPIRMTSYLFPPVRCGREENTACFLTPEEHGKLGAVFDSITMDNSRKQRRAEILANISADAVAQPQESRAAKCMAGRSAFWITWDGHMLPCGMLPRLGALLRETNFTRILGDFEQTMKMQMLPEKCSSCAKKILCPVCIAVTQSQNTVPDALCRYCDSYMAEFSAITRAET